MIYKKNLLNVVALTVLFSVLPLSAAEVDGSMCEKIYSQTSQNKVEEIKIANGVLSVLKKEKIEVQDR
ncbi:MAG: hypothetical protein HOP07_10245 [Bacteriovoracaceae bacterium]|nr:hypothetical protein [Bacteriovoracaceae bacterium]